MFVSIFLLLRCSLSSDDDLDVIRRRVLELVIWPSAATIPTVVQLATRYNEQLNRSCYWEDINYQDKTLAIWATEEHLTRVNVMIQALTVPGSSLQNDTQLHRGAHCALDVWLTRDWLNPNWWYNQIGVPLLATGQLLMLASDATAFETEKITEISLRADWWEHNPGTGANLVWMIQIELYRSLATANRTGIHEGFTRLWQDIVVLPLGGQGIQTDWSYHFHGNQLLSAAYGQDWVVAMMIFSLCSANTSYALTGDQLLTLARFLIEGDAWMIMENIWDWQVYGRAIDRPETILTIAFQSSWIRSLAQLLSYDPIHDDLIEFANRLDQRSDARPLLGNRHFYTSDYQVHRRVNWTSTIKMQSIRTQPTECINAENQRGEHLGQGVLNIYTSNPTDYREIFPLLDWQSINGITVETDIPIEACLRGIFDWTKLSFVGGVSDGDYGVAVMDTATHNLTARRSWHFYDQAIVALASRLTLTTTNRARTTLASRLLSEGNVTVTFFNRTSISLVDGVNYSFPMTNNRSDNVQWIHLSESNIAYLFETQGIYSSIEAETSQKTRSYNTIGPYNTSITARTVTVAIDHGRGPYTRDYSYIILPNITADSMWKTIEDYTDEKIFACQTNTDVAHGVSWPSRQRVSLVLWENVTTLYSCQSSSFQLNDAGVYLFNESSEAFSISAAHPTRLHAVLTVNVNRTGYGVGCTRLDDGTTNVTLVLPSSAQFLGTSIIVTCGKTNSVLFDFQEEKKRSFIQ